MTFTFNGIGTRISGGRKLTPKEKRDWHKQLPNSPEFRNVDFLIGTESLVVFYLPVYPIRSYVYCYVESKWYQSEKYFELFNPAGKGIYWPHVKKSWSFYVWPAILLFFSIVWFFSLF